MSATTARDLQGALSKLQNFEFKVMTEGGSSVIGLQNLQQGKIDVAMAMADVAYLAYAGQLDATSPPFDQLRGLAVVTLNTLHLVVAKGMDVKSISDLKGLRVALGPAGSATALIAERALEAHGIRLGDVKSARLSYVETADKLVNGEMDAAFMTQIPPSDPVVTAAKAGARLVHIGGPVIEQMRTRYPYSEKDDDSPGHLPESGRTGAHNRRRSAPDVPCRRRRRRRVPAARGVLRDASRHAPADRHRACARDANPASRRRRTLLPPAGAVEMRRVVAGLCLAVCSCTSAAETPPRSYTLRLAQTTSNQLANALNRLPNVHTQVVSGGGSSINSLIDLRNGKTDIIVPAADVAYLAYAGQLEEMPEPFDQLRGMAVTGLNAIHLLVAPKARVHSLRDLAGSARVARRARQLGRADCRPHASSAWHQVDKRPRGKDPERGDAEAAGARRYRCRLRDVHARQPGSDHGHEGRRHGSFHIDGPVVEEMRTQYPHLKRTLIPRAPIRTSRTRSARLASTTLLVCRADLDEDLVYSLLDAYFATRPGHDAARPRSCAGDADSSSSGRGTLLPPAGAVGRR